ncbi:4'-phosphopantetheinyl transferase sfp [Clostridium tepidiprofundi DSM 19306]|uniref:4'-phosphopantetheinyl transferase sfp n=1 Tax=Clostridium tepidiprofundi DSM 19306 TaxID=1121338 RepID=A0A151B230_9CLOT|nr:4'-phosphopantetheinyl transferase superfamily protein [Clostridium tepidiprofundi]KYH33964.1 4'-phosphopantetheinyl transferase sfp [Clostridium tepidiprofundi DSM 19306]
MMLDVLWIPEEYSIEEQKEKELRNKTLDTVKDYIRSKYNVLDVGIFISPTGKPFLTGIDDLYFSISHAKKATAIVIANRSIGIDLEKIHVSYAKIINSFFGPKEKKFILEKGLELNAMNQAFYQIWTRKEAFCKCIGEGITRKNLSVDTLDLCGYSIESFAINDYVLTICTKGENINICPQIQEKVRLRPLRIRN